MDIERKQREHVEHFVKQASILSGSSLTQVVVDATSHPSIFAFSEILAVPNVRELEGTENSRFLDLLQIFATGTWTEFKSVSSKLPVLVPGQILKLKQLTVLTMAETKKVLSYDNLLQELDFTNVRELENFLIDNCICAGIVEGKMNQLQRCFEVQFAAGRDVRPGEVESIIQRLGNLLSTSDKLLVTIQEKTKRADNESDEVDEHEVINETLALKDDDESQGKRGTSSWYGFMDYDEERVRLKRQEKWSDEDHKKWRRSLGVVDKVNQEEENEISEFPDLSAWEPTFLTLPQPIHNPPIRNPLTSIHNPPIRNPLILPPPNDSTPLLLSRNVALSMDVYGQLSSEAAEFLASLSRTDPLSLPEEVQQIRPPIHNPLTLPPPLHNPSWQPTFLTLPQPIHNPPIRNPLILPPPNCENPSLVSLVNSKLG